MGQGSATDAANQVSFPGNAPREGHSQAVPVDVNVVASALGAANRVTYPGSAPIASGGRSLLEATERALDAEAAGADRPSDDSEATTSFTLMTRPQ